MANDSYTPRPAPIAQADWELALRTLRAFSDKDVERTLYEIQEFGVALAMQQVADMATLAYTRTVQSADFNLQGSR